MEHSQANQPGLLGAADHFDVDAGPAPGGAQQLVAIRRLAHGARGHRAHVRCARGLRELGESDERSGTARNRFAGKASGAEDLRAEADGGAILGADLECAVRLGGRDLQPHGVRAEVDHRERLGNGSPHLSIMWKSTMEGMEGSTSTGRGE